MSGKLSRRRALALGGLTAGAVVAGTETASAATDWIRLPIVTANIGRNNLGAREDAIHDVRWCDGDRKPLVGWQEIREGDGDALEPRYINRHFADRYRNPFLWDDKSFRVPFSIPRRWKIVARRRTFGHGGVAGRTPPRWINEVVLQHVNHPNLEFALINTHYVANAYNGDRRPALQTLWKEHKAEHKARVLAHHRAGRLVIWTADTNNPDFRKATGWDAERQVFFRGIDRINWMPGNGRVRLDLVNKKTVDMRVDGHDARVAIFRIRLT